MVRILYVEDEKIHHMALERLTKAKGLPYEIEIAETVAQGVELLHKSNYDLVLIDYQLPDGTGLELLERIGNTPSIFITGCGDEMVAVKALKSGAYDYLVKGRELQYLDVLPESIEKVLRTFQLNQEHKRYKEHIARQNEELGRLNRELQRLYEEARECSFQDPLTGLANRRKMLDELGRAIALSKRQGTPLSAIMLDIDFFKTYNDTHGHVAGDKLLTEVSGLILSNARDSDLVARYGGEEFFVILFDTDIPGAVETARRIKNAFEETTDVTASLGVAGFAAGMDVSTLINNADHALYRAKENGRNRVEVFLA